MSRNALSIPLAGLVVLCAALAGCGAESTAQVAGHVSGRLQISADVDSTADYSGFEVVIASNTSGDIDTLAVAITDIDGNFSSGVKAIEKGVYPLIISRSGQNLAIEEIVLAEGDSVRITGTFPLEGRMLRIVSTENAAWTAYKNTKAQYNRMVLELVQSNPDYTEADMSRVIQQASSIFWGMGDTFPGTLGSMVASAESIVMLEGWADSVAVSRANQVLPEHPSRVPIVRALRRSMARLEGQAATEAWIRSQMDGSDADNDAALLAEVVVSQMDSLLQADAVATAREIQERYPDTQYSRWAEGAIYEVQHLLPGMQAPAFSVVDVDGEVLENEDFRDQFYMVEFYTPTHPLFQEEIGLRQAILNALDDAIFESVSISIDPDSAYNEALLDGRNLEGRFVFEPGGMESAVATAFNVNVIPTRVLVDPSGAIIGKYVGAALEELETDLAARLRALGGSQ